MKFALSIIAVTAIMSCHVLANNDQQALYFQTGLDEQRAERIARQTSSDQMVQNILQWLQGVYTQNSRKIRQGTLREYLPPSNTQKPRPFEPVSPPQYNGYAPSGSVTPQPAFPIFTNPTTGAVTGEGGYPSPTNEINPPYPAPSTPPAPTGRPGFPSQPPPQGFPTRPPPGFTTGYPPITRPGTPTRPPPGYPSQPPPEYPSQPPPEYSSQPPPAYPSQPPPGYPTQPPQGYPTPTPQGAGEGTPSTYEPGTSTVGGPSYTSTPGYPKEEPQGPELSTSAPNTLGPVTGGPSTYYTSPAASITTESSAPSVEDNSVVSGGKQEPSDTNAVTENNLTAEDLKHPPHIHAIDVECAKDMMTITIEFNREFNGVIYSKGHYNEPACRYVNENSETSKYKFTVSLNSCGTEFVNAFDTQNQSYLENILVIQNEAGIQEVWDTVRSVRCLWEGNLKDSLSVALSVGMLSQEIVTFSGDTAMARLDIQVGKGPFAAPASGLVKIGEPMTLVISVTGDPGFDIQVRDCRATDSSGDDHAYPLTDDNGCVLKPKLFGAFQKTRSTGNTGASVIAYAFFNAFKFPDVMDLMIQCNIELCKTDCQVCPDPDQKIEPGRRRRRRDAGWYNATDDGVTMGKSLRVVLPADLTGIEEHVLNVNHVDGVCMSTQNFLLSSVLLVSVLTASCLVSAVLWLKSQRVLHKM